MKKLFLATLTFVLMATGSTYAADNSKANTFNSLINVNSSSHICKQLGTKVCSLKGCNFVIGKPTIITTVITTQAEPTTQLTTKPQFEITTQATTKPQFETTTETTTQKETSTQTTTKETTTETTTKEATTETTTSSSNQQTGSYAQQVLNLVNAERAKNNLSPLTLSSSVSKVAQIKAEDMKNNNYFSHTSPTYGSPFEMLKQFGVSYKTAGENIAKGQKTPEAVVNAWMNSAGHRANILNKNYTQLGVGYTGGSSPYWVQMFIG